MATCCSWSAGGEGVEGDGEAEGEVAACCCRLDRGEGWDDEEDKVGEVET